MRDETIIGIIKKHTHVVPVGGEFIDFNTKDHQRLRFWLEYREPPFRIVAYSTRNGRVDASHVADPRLTNLLQLAAFPYQIGD